LTGGAVPLADISIGRLADLAADGADVGDLIAGMTTIFRATAARWPAEADAARAFQELWLDQYITHERDLIYLALQRSTGVVAGYLLGCRIDPSLSQRFASLDYFQTFAKLCQRYPAHLHINMDAGFRSRGIGAQLVAAFKATLAAEKITGLHVVTARDQRNVDFYLRLGFRELASKPRGSTEVLFLARSTAP